MNKQVKIDDVRILIEFDWFTCLGQKKREALRNTAEKTGYPLAVVTNVVMSR